MAGWAAIGWRGASTLPRYAIIANDWKIRAPAYGQERGCGFGLATCPESSATK